MRRLNGEYIKTISVPRSVTRRMPVVYMNSEAGLWNRVAMRIQEIKELKYLDKRDRRFDMWVSCEISVEMEVLTCSWAGRRESE
jgi:hypothetical protein